MLYAFVRVLARVALRWFYRSVEVINADRVPAQGAVILAANHSNALVDALVVGTSLDRPVRLTAKATLLDHPLTRWVIRALGVVPLRRTADELAGGSQVVHDRNASAFEAVVETLRAGGVVLIFPEGRSHSDPSLSSLRTGCARIALQSRAAGVDPLVIVPVGIVFEQKDRPRSRVAIRFGTALNVGETAGSLPELVFDWTTRLDAALRDVTLNFESHDEATRVLQISQVLATVMNRLGPLDHPEPSLGGTLDVAERVNRARLVLHEFPDETIERVDHFLQRLDSLRRDLRAIGVPITELWLDLDLRSGLLFAVREALVFSIAAPVALWGKLNHWVPLRLATWLGRVTSRHPDEPAMHTLIGGLAALFVFYGAVATIAYRVIGGIGAVAYVASLPPAASVSFWTSERWRRAIERARSYLLFRRRPELQRRLVAEAASLRADAERLEVELTARTHEEAS